MLIEKIYKTKGVAVFGLSEASVAFTCLYNLVHQHPLVQPSEYFGLGL